MQDRRPSTYCNSRNCCRNGSQLGESSMMPMRAIFLGKPWARAPIGHTAEAPPRNVMNSRLLMAVSQAED